MNEILENLYEVFRPFKPADLDCCTCCHDVDFVPRLKNIALKYIDRQDLITYLGSALMTCNGDEAFKYLLPRLLEGLPNYLWEIRCTLERAEWLENWTSVEINAVKNFILNREVISSFFYEGAEFFSIDDLISIWLKNEKFLADSIQYWIEVDNSFFDTYWRPKKTFISETSKSEILDFLEELFYANSEKDPIYAENISRVIEYFEWCKIKTKGLSPIFG